MIKSKDHLQNFCRNLIVACDLQYSLLQRMFFKFDRDRSGTLERDEVVRAVRDLGKMTHFYQANRGLTF